MKDLVPILAVNLETEINLIAMNSFTVFRFTVLALLSEVLPDPTE
jgi:hypothetical protein